MKTGDYLLHVAESTGYYINSEYVLCILGGRVYQLWTYTNYPLDRFWKKYELPNR